MKGRAKEEKGEFGRRVEENLCFGRKGNAAEGEGKNRVRKKGAGKLVFGEEDTRKGGKGKR